MSSWNFDKEKNQTNTGSTTTNPTGGLKAGWQPFYQAGTLASKRNVIITDKGWVRRTIKRTDGNAPRIIDEVIVAAHPGAAAYSEAAYMGFPDVAQIYLMDSSSVPLVPGVSLTSGGSYKVGVVYNEPIRHVGTGNIILTVANTAGGSSTVATNIASNANTGMINANNTLVFSFTAGTAGTYKINAQTMTNATSTAIDLRSRNTGAETANLVITGAVSNALSTFTIV